MSASSFYNSIPSNRSITAAYMGSASNQSSHLRGSFPHSVVYIQMHSFQINNQAFNTTVRFSKVSVKRK